MNHFFLFLNIFCLTSGASGIILAILLYIRNKNNNFFIYLITLIIWTINYILLMLMIYLDIVKYKNILLLNLILILRYLSWGLLIIFLPILIHKFLKKKINISFFILIVFSSFIISFPSAVILNYKLEKYIITMHLIQLVIFYSILFYLMLFIISKIKDIKNNDIKIILRILIYLQFIFYPLLIIEKLPFFANTFPNGFGIYSLFYFLTNLLWLIFASKYLYFPEIKIDNDYTPLENFFNIYSISEREKEIVPLILEGLSYKEISDRLFISYETVKTHINNIYRKTNSKNKINLFRIIKKCSN